MEKKETCSHEFKNMESSSTSHKAQDPNKSWNKFTYYLNPLKVYNNLLFTNQLQ